MFVQFTSNADNRHLTNRPIPQVLPFLAVLLLTGLTFGTANRARAQSETPAKSKAIAKAVASVPTSALGITTASWRAHFGEQVAAVLRGQSQAAKEAAMRDVIASAKTGQRGIDLSAAVAPLLKIAQNGSSKDHRIMALQALGAIGPEHSSELLYDQAMKQLRSDLEAESSDRVRRVTRTVINGFYAEESK